MALSSQMLSKRKIGPSVQIEESLLKAIVLNLEKIIMPTVVASHLRSKV